MKTNTSLRRWAELILQVRAAQLTASAAAAQLGISRKTYYQWERRALRGLMAALREGPAGRPRSGPPAQVLRLRRKIQRLEQRLKTSEQLARLRQIVAQLHQPQSRAKKGDSSPCS